jgi:hypothetical protein
VGDDRSPLLERGRKCWRIDVRTASPSLSPPPTIFRLVKAAMLKAERRIMLIG